jgi:trans-aconitate methyltransferase
VATTTARDIVEVVASLDLHEQHNEYLALHANRLAYAINTIRAYRANKPVKQLLDIGPHFLTRCISEFFPDIEISTLGWKLERIFPARLCKEHIQYDLNDCGSCDIVSLQAPFDLIVCSEVIEHLYTSPALVLKSLQRLLTARGALFIQTPNAATLSSRVALLRGRNPYQLIREQRTNPGHFREYTLDELVTYARAAEFTVLEAEYCSYWVHPIAPIRLVENAIPSFRRGMSLLIENTKNG